MGNGEFNEAANPDAAKAIPFSIAFCSQPHRGKCPICISCKQMHHSLSVDV
jgi:hypothetical protein